ncbi:MAG: DUF6800 family protein [Candidatus Brocadiales bacterium]
MSKPTHPKVIARRRHRREKLVKLRRKYAAATTEAERQRIFEKACKIAPTLTWEQFIAPLRARGLL